MANILIIDDEEAIRNVLRDILEMEDYEVDEAKDGIEALSKIKQALMQLSAISKCQKWMGWNCLNESIF